LDKKHALFIMNMKALRLTALLSLSLLAMVPMASADALQDVANNIIMYDQFFQYTPNQMNLDVALTKNSYLFNQNLRNKNQYYYINSSGSAVFIQQTPVNVTYYSLVEFEISIGFPGKITILYLDPKTYTYYTYSQIQPSPAQQSYAETWYKVYAAVQPDPNLFGEKWIDQWNKNYRTFLNQLSPGLYTALPSILFNSANVQNTQIQQRLWAARSGNPDNSRMIEGQGDGDFNGSRKTGMSAMATDPKWTTFADGNGMWSQAQSVNNLPSYNSYAGGVQAGASYQACKDFQIGPYVGYQGTRVNFTGSNGGGSSATDNSVRFGLFAEYAKGGFYSDGIVGGAYNSVAVRHGISLNGLGTTNSFNSTANSTTAGGELDSLLGTGYNFRAGKLTFGPSTSLQYTYLNLGSAQESGSGPLDLTVGSQNASSLLYTLGGQVSYDIDLSRSLKLQPFGSLAWQHEFLQNGYNLTSSIGSQSFGYQTANPGRDQYIAAIGGNLVITKSISTYAVCNLIHGDSQVFSQAISGGINWKF
jgi:outer membrane autotransporter protein